MGQRLKMCNRVEGDGVKGTAGNEGGMSPEEERDGEVLYICYRKRCCTHEGNRGLPK